MDQKQITQLPLAGTLIGALIAYLLRPEAPQIGQLPFGVVMTRGADLSGLDEMLIPIAEASFNYTVAGAIIGAIIGTIVFWVMSNKMKK
ncbi:hypothetical protein SAMN04488587_1119 [Methanococcoides vulcani]|uniref:Uncharacterized protein n=1 Tax=Methanococcoides vulcani TaxID=1353158 RepID=A0A1H9ZID3_9EURY|nr:MULTISPECIES: hypothetical protein [Methanococcoides]SES80835.1 hypothetical protein SAMN04488587_1119 [Methanococcoides vulcani]